MGGFQHLHFMPISERSVTYRRILSNLFWIYTLVIGFPEERKGWRLRADVGTKQITKSLYFPIGKVFFKLLTIWESQTFNRVQDAFQHFDTVCNISYFYLCKVFCFSHEQRQIHMNR